MAGLVVTLLLVAISAAAPLVAPYDPIKQVPPEAYRGPSTAHLLGTDNFGRDLLSRILWGGRVSLSIGLVSVAIGVALGVPSGLVAGYYGRAADWIIGRVVDVMLALPGILLALAVVAVLGTGIFNVIIAVGISSIPVYTRLVRGSVLAAREMSYVEAARVVGCVDYLIIARHILPNVLAPVIVVATLGVAGAIIAGAALSFLGLGAQPPNPEWGVMLAGGRAYLRQAWWISTFPGVSIMLAVLAINMFGDGLRDVLDPRLKVD